MVIRRSKTADINSIMPIYDYAREQMALNGNPTQWIDGYPTKEIILNDIATGNSYVIESKWKVCGVFTFIIGTDPTYQKIDGKWLDDEPYGTIHRIASDGTQKGIFIECLNFCKSKISDIRIDTHSDNKIMQHLLYKNGFTKCGTIIGRDGAKRIAYQKKF
ncbi:MAG: N-acetyltransferase [Clostridiales bacterium]|nr:N-acetyltransferase [Clostridiales bacterium]